MTCIPARLRGSELVAYLKDAAAEGERSLVITELRNTVRDQVLRWLRLNRCGIHRWEPQGGRRAKTPLQGWVCLICGERKDL